jgi:CDP-2,3-bis-(O-geranylgeranyl)-sn-glycerol synthase
MLIAANGVPILLHHCLGTKLSRPIDGGILLPDGYRLFGCAKTWRGFWGGIIAAVIVAILSGFSIVFGIVFGLLSLLGDLLSSFIKRRMKLHPSSQSIGTDQLPESVLPLIAGAYWLNYGLSSIVIVTLSFFLLNILATLVLSQFAKRPPAE